MKSQYIVVGRDSVRLHYVTCGKGQPLVLLHGFPTDWRLWRHNIEPWSTRFRVYALDLPGHGYSERRPELVHDLDFYLDILTAFLDALGLDRVRLVTHDLGGMVGLAFTGRQPTRVERLVVMDTAPYSGFDLLMRIALRLLRNSLVGWLLGSRPGFLATLWLFTTRKWKVLRRLVDLYQPMWSDTPSMRRMFRLAASVSPAHMAPTGEDLQRIECPTLILWADSDPIFPLEIAERLERDLKNASLVTVPGCGHFVPEEYPDLVTEHVSGFLATGDRARTVAAHR